MNSCLEPPQAVVDLFVSGGERRKEPDHVLEWPGLQQEQAPRASVVDDAVGERRVGLLRPAIDDQFDREHAAQATDVADRRNASLQHQQSVSQRRADRSGAIDDPLCFEDVEHGQRGCTGDGVAGVGAPEPSRQGRIHHLRVADDGGQGQSAAQALCQGDEIGLDGCVLVGEHPAGSSEPGLDFVGNQDDAVIRRERSQLLQEFERGRNEPAFAELGLDDDRRDLIGCGVCGKEAAECVERTGCGPPSVHVGYGAW